MRHTEADREMAARHVAEGEARIEDLRDRIGKARAKGFSTDLSERALTTMLVTLGHMRQHLAEIEADLDG